MTHGLCSCHSEQSEESFSILRVFGLKMNHYAIEGSIDSSSRQIIQKDARISVKQKWHSASISLGGGAPPRRLASWRKSIEGDG